MPERAPVPAPDGAFDADAVWTLFEGRTDRMVQVWRISRSTLPICVDGLESAVEARRLDRSGAARAFARGIRGQLRRPRPGRDGA